jgi:hypothetical protein
VPFKGHILKEEEEEEKEEEKMMMMMMIHYLGCFYSSCVFF